MTDTATAVSAAPFVVALQPYLTAAATAIVGGAVTLAAAAFRKWTGVQLQAAFVEQVRQAAEAEAGAAVAAAEDNLAHRTISVGSPLVAAAADRVGAKLPAVMAAAGLRPDDVEHLVAAEIGKLQASMTSVAPVAASAPASPGA